MKMTKRILSLLLTVVMLITVVSTGLSALAAVSISNTAVTATVVVPELIYLTPGGNSFQYYIAGAANNATPSTSKNTQGSISFACNKTMSSISVSVAGATSAAFSPASATNTSSFTSTITGGAKSGSGVITWTFTYVIEGITYYSYAYSYVYAPYLGQVGCEGGYQYKTSIGNEPKLAATAMILGIHSVTGGAYNSTYIGTSGTSMSPLVPGWGSANVPAASDNAIMDAVYYPVNTSNEGGIAGFGRARDDKKSATFGGYGAYGTITVDGSRYGNGQSFSLIPNLSAAWMIHYTASSSDNHKLSSFRSTDSAISFASSVDYANEGGCQAYGLYAPTGSVPSADTRYNFNVDFHYERSSSSGVHLYLLFSLQLNIVDKSALRTSLNNAISACYQQLDYTSDSWATYSTALANAGSVLGNPASSADQLSAAKTQLDNAVSGLVKNEYTYTVTHKLPAVDGFQYTVGGNTYVAEGGFITIVETGSYESNSHVTVSANTYTGYAFNATASNPASVEYKYQRTNVTHTFTYTALTSTIHFVYGTEHAGFLTNASTGSMTVSYGQKYGTLPAPKMDGWRFNGWYNGSTRVYGTETCTMINGSLTLTASWTCYFGGGHGSSADPFIINNNTHLDNIDDTTVLSSTEGKYFLQNADIAFSLNHCAVDEFKGVYNGAGNDIVIASSASIGETTYAGVFGNAENATISNIIVTMAGNMSASGTTGDKYVGFVAHLNNSSLNNIQITFSGAVSAVAGGGAAYTGVMAGLVSGTSSITNSSVTLNGGSISNAGTPTAQNGFIGGTASGANVTKSNTWTLVNVQPTGYAGAGSANVMSVRENGSATLSYANGTYTFSATPDEGWTAVYRNSLDVVVNSTSSYSPAASINGVNYYICFLKQVGVATSTGGTVAGAGTYDLRQGQQITGIVATAGTGYHFTQWANTTDGTITPVSESDPKAISFTMNTQTGTITAQFALNTYTLEYNANAGSSQVSVPSSAVYQYGDSVVIAAPAIRPGYIFKEWNTSSDGTGTAYTSQQTYTNLSTVDGDTVTLYAIWELQKFNVTFEENGGSTVNDYLNVAYGTEITFVTPTKAGYAFANWFETADFTGNSYVGGARKIIYASASFYAKWTPITYTITYVATDATSVPPVQTATYDDIPFSISATVPVKAGYRFVEWNTDAGGSGTVYSPNATITQNLCNTQNANYNLYAVWAAKSFTVMWNLNADDAYLNNSQAIENSSVVFGGTYTVPSGAFSRYGYKFMGWFTAETGGTKISTGDTVAITDNATFYAQWQLIKYTVFFAPNFANYNAQTNGTMESMSNCEFNSTYELTLNGFTRSGYNFSGWALTAGSTSIAYINGDSIYNLTGEVNGNVVLYAVWSARSYNVTYNRNGGTGAQMLASPVKMDATITLKNCTYTKTGYKFVGWASSVENAAAQVVYANNLYTMTKGEADTVYASWILDTATYTVEHYQMNVLGTYPSTPDIAEALTGVVGQTVEATPYTSLETVPTAFSNFSFDENNANNVITGTVIAGETQLVLKVYYSRNQYEVSYDANTGAGEMAAQSFYYGATGTLSSNTFTREGYTFRNWSTSADGSGSVYSNNGAFTMGSGNTTLYAIWGANSYRVLFNANGGTGEMGYQEIVYGESEELNANTFVRSGYTFGGWSLTATGTKLYDDGATIQMGIGNINLFAVWLGDTYTLSFDGNSGVGSMDEITLTADQTITLPACGFTLQGYTLDVWSYNDGERTYADGTSFTMDMHTAVTLVAQWKTASYTIQFDSNGGTSVAAITAPYGSAITQPADPTKAGHLFLGWQLNNVDYTITTMPAENITLVANWMVRSFSVIFNSNGGTGSMSRQTITYGETVPLNANEFTRTGYTFYGWARTDTGARYCEDGAAFEMVFTANVTLYAMWTANSYTVLFDGNGSDGGSQVTGITVQYDVAGGFTLPANTFTKTGATFAGWALTADGTKAYDNSAVVTDNLATGETGSTDATLFALWTNNLYTVTYDANGATAGTAPAQVTDVIYGAQFALLDGTGLAMESDEDEQSRSFLGWYTEINGTVTEYEVGDTFTVPAQNVTLYALWSANYYALNEAVALVTGYQTSGKLPASASVDPAYVAGATMSTVYNEGSGEYAWSSFNTTTLEVAYLNAQADENKDFPQTRQADVDALKAAIDNALENLALLSANFNASVACSHYSESFVDSSSMTYYPACTPVFTHSFSAVMTACNTIINTDDADNIYTAESVEALNIAIYGNGSDVTGIYNTVTQMKIKLPAQASLDYYTDLLIEIYHSTPKLKLADYSGIDYLTDVYLPNRDGVEYGNMHSYYEEESILGLTGIMEMIDADGRALKIIYQNVIDDEYCPMLQEAIDCLVALPASYSVIFSMILERIPTGTDGFSYPAQTVEYADYAAWLTWAQANSGAISQAIDIEYLAPRYTPQSLTTLYNMLNSIDWELDVFGQNTIDAISGTTYSAGTYARELELAIAGLVGRTYTVTYMVNDGTLDVFATRTVSYLAAVPNVGTPIRDGFEFKGWETEAGLAVSYTDQVTADMILRAKWGENTVDLVSRTTHTAVIDTTHSYIYGLKTGATEAELNSDYLEVLGNGYLRYNSSVIGTGTTVDLVSNVDGSVLATYTIIIFGDINGDGLVNNFDRTSLKMHISGIASIDPASATGYACDFTGDGVINANDATALNRSLNGGAVIDQVNHTVG